MGIIGIFDAAADDFQFHSVFKFVKLLSKSKPSDIMQERWFNRNLC